MTADAYSTYVNMFLALDALWDECHGETLAGYLSEANPYLFRGQHSADPAVWSEFSAAFNARFDGDAPSLEDAHAFVVDYLMEISDEYAKAYPGEKRLVEAFLEIAPLGRWEEAFEPREVGE